MSNGPLFAYRALLRDGTLTPDPCQELAAEKLQALHHALSHYDPPPIAGEGGLLRAWRARLGLGESRRDAVDAPQGLYLFGGVGRGKSMLMDLFFENVTMQRKRRVHFHAFMLEVHGFLHRHRRLAANGGPQDAGVDAALPLFADALARSAVLLCFDEFHVTDIADAMLLGRLLQGLFDRGVVLVATSNWPPDDLYKDGLQRDRFLPTIALIKEKLDIFALESGQDYRLARLRDRTVFHWPLGPAADQALIETFRDLTDGAAGAAMDVPVQGRVVKIKRAAKGVAWIRYDDLAANAWGPADALAVAQHFHTVILEGVPVLPAHRRDEVKRLMVLIDALYEHRVNLVCSAARPPEDWHPDGSLAFEFQRTVSRLIEMQSADYIAKSHVVEAAVTPA